MSYKKGIEVLPAHLLEEVQKYIDGTLIYIPKKGKRVGWGYSSGIRNAIDKRNKIIVEMFRMGKCIDEIADRFFLSEETIKKIIYSKK
ncbi:hypothetical protein GOQ27_09830 [Clostridium sp. D2Q-11]|uniref:Mor transcription activator family protein n=1 Tax=Anaeromonas frigoriresistens TaxID=2683708 RepID=A0A942Z962_9FIRM|nr:CD3324 family protein [Anaeromonas frigoriresistens]MBS4538764.1 hypothetical protein [Anaeromonas frigoriresistens]